ncbi:hypothetical protein [Burkholderia cenocepacia]|uniref:hypothetical protein n=1 Tax=Burkholderia cenocepacia TaxID=95486 RepID=UPI0028545BE6|nr:hypothetical protein [Burkholderia cenocepacia]MDR8052202.1 hypothetical protein [Burkholderia cenocepacia]
MRRRIADADSRHRIDRPGALTCHACRIHIVRIRLIRRAPRAAAGPVQPPGCRREVAHPFSVRPAAGFFRISGKNRPCAERPRHRINRSNFPDDLFLPDASTPKTNLTVSLLAFSHRAIARIMKFSLPRAHYFLVASPHHLGMPSINVTLNIERPDGEGNSNLHRSRHR